MPKFRLSRKKKKKVPGIRDSLAPLPAFVAVPDFTSREATHQPVAGLQAEATGNQQRQSRAIGTQSEWPPKEEDSDDDSVGLGYATVLARASIADNTTGTESAVDGAKSSAANPNSPTRRRPLPEPPVHRTGSTRSPSGSHFAAGGPSADGKQKLEPDWDTNRPITPTGTTRTNIIRDVTFSPGGAVALYTRVSKSAAAKSASTNKAADTSTALPPKGASRKGRHNQQTKGRWKSYRDEPRAGNSELHREAETAGGTNKNPGYLSWDGAEYTDEEYLPSGEDTFSITETNSSDVELMLQDLRYDAAPQRTSSPQKPSPAHLNRHSAPVHSHKSRHTHHTPLVNRPRSLTPDYRPNAGEESPAYPRSNSAPLPENIPFIQPASIHQLQPQDANGEVYIFSETQPDGCVQYYTATPVRSPAITKYPLSNIPLQHGHSNSPQPYKVTPRMDGSHDRETLAHALIQQPAASNTPHAHLDSGTVLESDNPSATISPTLTSPVPLPKHRKQVIPPPTYTPPLPKHHNHPILPPDANITRSKSVSGEIIGTRITRLVGSLPEDSSRKKSLGIKVDPRNFVGLPIGRLGKRSDYQWEMAQRPSDRSHEEYTDMGTGLPANRGFKQLGRTEGAGHTVQASGETFTGAKVDRDSKLRKSYAHPEPERTRLEGANTVPAGSPDHAFREKIRSLLADNAALGQELAREETQRKIAEDHLIRLEDEIAKLQEENRKLMDDKQCLELEGISVDHLAHTFEDEKSSLVKQLDKSRQLNKELRMSQSTKVSALNDELQMMKDDRDSVKGKLMSLSESHTLLSYQFEKLMKSLPAHVSLEEHQEVLANIQNHLDDLSEQNEMKLRSKETELRLHEKEKKSLVFKLTDAAAVIVKLEEENDQIKTANMRAQETISELRHELEHSRDREVTAHEQLSSAVNKAERAIAEKNSYAKIAKVQKKSAERAVVAEVENQLVINNLERQLESCEEQLHELDTAASVSKKDHSQEKKQYVGEIKHLRSTLSRKQKQVVLLAQEKRDAEDRLDFVWRASMSGSPGLEQRRPTGSLSAPHDLLGRPSGSISPHDLLGRRSASVSPRNLRPSGSISPHNLQGRPASASISPHLLGRPDSASISPHLGPGRLSGSLSPTLDLLKTRTQSTALPRYSRAGSGSGPARYNLDLLKTQGGNKKSFTMS